MPHKSVCARIVCGENGTALGRCLGPVLGPAWLIWQYRSKLSSCCWLRVQLSLHDCILLHPFWVPVFLSSPPLLTCLSQFRLVILSPVMCSSRNICSESCFKYCLNWLFLTLLPHEVNKENGGCALTLGMVTLANVCKKIVAEVIICLATPLVWASSTWCVWGLFPSFALMLCCVLQCSWWSRMVSATPSVCPHLSDEPVGSYLHLGLLIPRSLQDRWKMSVGSRVTKTTFSGVFLWIPACSGYCLNSNIQVEWVACPFRKMGMWVRV